MDAHRKSTSVSTIKRNNNTAVTIPHTIIELQREKKIKSQTKAEKNNKNTTALIIVTFPHTCKTDWC